MGLDLRGSYSGLLGLKRIMFLEHVFRRSLRASPGHLLQEEHRDASERQQQAEEALRKALGDNEVVPQGVLGNKFCFFWLP